MADHVWFIESTQKSVFSWYFPTSMEVGKYRLLCGVLNTLLMGVSLLLILISHYPSSFDTARTPTTRASTLVLACVLLSLSSRPRGRTGHERAHRCSLVSSSLSLQDRADAQDTSEHIGARSCPVCPSLSFRHHGDTKDTSEH